MNFESAEEQL